MPPTVLWIRAAEERLAAALRQTTQQVGTPQQAQADISARLAAAFPRAIHVVVLDYYVGFKHRPGEHILQAEVKRPGDTSSLVVKIAGPERLLREKKAWDHAKMVQGGNPVFMPLHACPEGAADDALVAIAYLHAEKAIGADTTTWLEAAVRDCVCYHSVNLQSIISVLHDIYSQTGRLYSTGRLEPAGQTCIWTTPTRRVDGERHALAPTFDLWNTTGKRTRQQVNASFTVGSTSFIDPVDAFRHWDQMLKLPNAPADLLPMVMRGLSHGDLHGRNSIVGIDKDRQASFPTLFDYESIHPDNLIGWDFVEMEVELKSRIYEKIIPHTNRSAWIRKVQEFEAELNFRTRHCHNNRSWPGGQADATTPEARLMAVLLAIRQEASTVLMSRPRTPAAEWLREYLFLLGCYGLMAVRYENQTELQLAAAFVTAGMAASRLNDMRGSTPEPAADVDAILAESYITCQIPLRAAREWNRKKAEDKAERLLTGLVARYPATLHVHYEQAFNLVKQKRGEEALKKLEKLHTEFDGALDEDTWSLWGRCHKDHGDAELVAGMKQWDSPDARIRFEEGDRHYHDSLTKYQAALMAAGGFFSSINIATLTFLRAALCKHLNRDSESQQLRKSAIRVAAELLETKTHWKQLQPDDPVWVWATEAEALSLTGKWADAGASYRAAVARPQCLTFHPESMGRQLARILAGYRLLDEAVSLDAFGDLGLMNPHVTLE
ncbi:MAG TPA: tetratricopeptide repeat-containing protein [Gemmataceae bacterium]|nr:tetratricopeptide repeat-containing protein [Gemmataceae bacterium]